MRENDRAQGSSSTWVLAVFVLACLVRSAQAQVPPADQKCITAFNKSVRDIAKVQGQNVGRCLNSGKGELLPDTTLPFQLPVTAQLYASDGACWEAEFGAAETRRNELGGFSGKSPAP